MSVERWTLDSLIETYREDQRRTRGLREQTLDGYERLVRMFVRAALGEDPIDPTRLSAGDVVGFVAVMQGRFSPCSMKAVRTALRSFFRFLRVEGLCDGRLELAVPRVAHWRLSTLPRYLSDAQLASCSRRWMRPRRAGAGIERSCCVWRAWDCGLVSSPIFGLRTSTGAAVACCCASARPARARSFRSLAMPAARSSPTCAVSARRPTSAGCSCSTLGLVVAGRCLQHRLRGCGSRA